jgi:hypothetical protein
MDVCIPVDQKSHFFHFLYDRTFCAKNFHVEADLGLGVRKQAWIHCFVFGFGHNEVRGGDLASLEFEEGFEMVDSNLRGDFRGVLKVKPFFFSMLKLIDPHHIQLNRSPIAVHLR